MNLGFALEYSLGHITHAQNLKHTLEGRSDIVPSYVDLPYEGIPAAWAKLPGIRSNWSLRASLGAWLGLRGQARRLDGVLFHTQVTSLFSSGIMRRVPSVISLDATPLQYDALGSFYNHQPSSNPRLEAVKKRLNQRAFGTARQLVTWSQWAKDSLVSDYGVPPEKITVIPPGIDTARWNFDRTAHSRDSGAVNLLFVGGDFTRKGGETLLRAFTQLPPSLNAHLNIVTKKADIGVNNSSKITVRHSIKPNSPELLQLFAEADIFVFPTQGDCLPLAVMEALAAGLPVITTTTGALPEAVRHGQTGWIVPPEDPAALAEALKTLIDDRALRLQMGVCARTIALERFDAERNYRLLVNLLAAAGQAASPTS